jgi:hypothetical protein
MAHHQYFADFVRSQFRARANSDQLQADKLLSTAQEFSRHLDKSKEYTEVLKRCNITVNLDSAQRKQVEHIAKRVGLIVPPPQV